MKITAKSGVRISAISFVCVTLAALASNTCTSSTTSSTTTSQYCYYYQSTATTTATLASTTTTTTATSTTAPTTTATLVEPNGVAEVEFMRDALPTVIMHYAQSSCNAHCEGRTVSNSDCAIQTLHFYF